MKPKDLEQTLDAINAELQQLDLAYNLAKKETYSFDTRREIRRKIKALIQQISGIKNRLYLLKCGH
jgi:hypothetical protein